MSSFKVPCPSCEAQVLIKNPNLVGTKVECPKCKYRFKVEAPAGEAPKDDKAAKDKDKKAEDKAKKPAAKKNKKVLGAVLGVAGVLLLAVGGYAMFGGKSKSGTSGGPSGGPVRPASLGGNTDDPNAEQAKDKEPDKKGTVAKSNLPRSDKDPTNLLPGEAVSVYRFNVKKMARGTELTPLFDPAMLRLFAYSMGFGADAVDSYYHCAVGPNRDPFGVIRLDTPVDPKAVVRAMQLEPEPKTIKTRTLHQIRSNPFVTAVASALAFRSLLGDVYEKMPGPAAGAEKPLGVCVYDTQTILVGDHAVLEHFLTDLKDNGYPEYKTELSEPPPPPPMDPMPMGQPQPGAPTAPAPGAPAGTGTPGAATINPTPAAPAQPTPPPPKAAGPTRNFTTIPTYRTIDGQLKRMLNGLYESEDDAPLIAAAEKFDAKAYDPKLFRKRYEEIGKVLAEVLPKVRYVGGMLTAFNSRQLAGTVRLVAGSDDEAREIALDNLTPALHLAGPVLDLLLGAPAQVRNYASGELPFESGGPFAPGGPGGAAGTPFGPGGLLGPGGLFSGGLRPGMGGPAASASGPGSVGPGMPGRGGSGPVGEEGPGGPGRPGFGRPGMGIPGRGGSGPGFPGPGPVGEGGEQPFGQPLDPLSHVDLRLTDNVVTFAVEMGWTDEAYRKTISPGVVGLINQVKGKVAVYAGSDTWHALSRAVAAYVKQKNEFPRGTFRRVSSTSEGQRYGLTAPPAQRVSFFAELMPYLGRDVRVDPKAAWYDERNVTAAEAWIPELLIPYYPQSAWRATSPFAPERVFGGTDFVAIAGVGTDAARYDPARNAEHKKLAGITGYDWGSTVADVTDGLANTIYLMQVAPGFSRPWIAGGGATVMGLDPADPLAPFVADHPDGRGGKKRGTYAIMGDGTVRWIPADIDPKTLLNMATRAGGEKIENLDKIAPKVLPPAKEEEKPAAETDAKPAPKAEAPPADKKEAPKGDAAPPPKEK